MSGDFRNPTRRAALLSAPGGHELYSVARSANCIRYPMRVAHLERDAYLYGAGIALQGRMNNQT